MSGLNTTKTFLLDLLFPKVCFSCGRDGTEFCSECIARIQLRAPQCLVCNARSLDGKICSYCRTKTSLSRFFAIGDYDDPILREAIHFLKYRKVTSLAAPLADLAFSYWQTFMQNLRRKPHMLIPIPLHPRRERQRSFNQTELIARQLADKIKIPLEAKMLERTKHAPPQVGIEDPVERRKNVQGVFRIRNPELARGKTILLFDDVATTGATLNEAASVLKEAGARSMWGMVLAR